MILKAAMNEVNIYIWMYAVCIKKQCVHLIFLTLLQGHGGNGFLKFQDSEEITNIELADAFEQMWQKRR